MVRPGACVGEPGEFRIAPHEFLDPLPRLFPDLAEGDLADGPMTEVVPRERSGRKAEYEGQEDRSSQAAYYAVSTCIGRWCRAQCHITGRGNWSGWDKGS
jgi:hypothetical protein